jgi:capsular exopolysaccharide synthesis family protein
MVNEPESSIDIAKRFLQNVINYKYFYIFCFALFITISFLFNKYTPGIYEVKATIGPVENTASSLLGSNDLFMGLKSLQSNRNIENGINSLMSFPIVSTTINNLNLETGYFRERVKLFRQTADLYLRSPFIVTMDKSHVQPINLKFYIQILSDTTYRLTASQNKVVLYNYLDNQIVSENNILKFDSISNFNKTIKNKNFKLTVSFQKVFQPYTINPEDQYYFTFYHLDFLTEQYLKNLKVELLSPKTSLIVLKFRGTDINKSVSFLNRYVDVSLEENLAKKNKIALSTINFIESQLSEISDSLSQSESRLKNYKSANQVMDLSFQGKTIYEKLNQIETERANLEIQSRYYNYIINNFKTNNDASGVVPPSAMNVADPIMNQLITELLNLYSQRSAISGNNSQKNLFIGQIEKQIKMQRQQIIENVTSNLNTLNASLNELNYRSDKLSREISQLPRTELNMVGIQRKFNLNSVIYTYLLQKRSEAGITMASNYPDYEIIEPAREFTKTVIIPRPKISYLLALFLALLIPTLYIFLKDILNNKLSTVGEVEQIIKRPVLTSVFHNNLQTEAVVSEYPRTAISESFRNLRSSLFFKLKSAQSKIVLVTSSQPKDGKSFISFNLATVIAAVGYKTIILDCDLRKPTLHEKFEEENSSGLSNIMTGEATADEVIRKTNVKNLSFIPAGPLLPNPSELIEAGALTDLINLLDKKYDYIIIDTSPIGLVADSAQMIKYASQILLISRFNYTRKDIFSDVINGLRSIGINNYDVIFNGLSLKTSPYRHYSSYYLKK